MLLGSCYKCTSRTALKSILITNIGSNERSKYIKSYLNSKGKKMLLEIYAVTGLREGELWK